MPRRSASSRASRSAVTANGGALLTQSAERCVAVSQPAHARRGRQPLRGVAHRHERPAGYAAGRRPARKARRVRGGACRARAHRFDLRPASGGRRWHSGACSRQCKRLGDLRHPAARRCHARPAPGRFAVNGCADGDLLPAPAAPHHRPTRRITAAAACPFRRILPGESWPCRYTRISPRRTWQRIAGAVRSAT